MLRSTYADGDRNRDRHYSAGILRAIAVHAYRHSYSVPICRMDCPAIVVLSSPPSSMEESAANLSSLEEAAPNRPSMEEAPANPSSMEEAPGFPRPE